MRRNKFVFISKEQIRKKKRKGEKMNTVEGEVRGVCVCEREMDVYGEMVGERLEGRKERKEEWSQ